MTFTSLLQFCGQNLALVCSAWLLGSILRKTPSHSHAKTILTTAVIYFSEILIIEFILGSFSKLSNSNASIFSYGLFLIVFLFFYKKIPNLLRNKKSDRFFEKKSTNKLAIFTLLIIFAPVIGFLLIKLFTAMLQIPMEYDSLSYHLPFVAKWLQTGNLLKPYYTAFGGQQAGFYPSNYELLDLWYVLPFHMDFFVNLLNFPLFILLGTVVYKVCRNLKIPPRISAISMGFLFYMPVFLNQGGVPQVDLFFSLTFACAIYFLQEIFKNKNQTLDLLCFGLSLGLFMGTKYLGLIYFIPIFIIFLIIRRKLKAIILVLLSIILTGSFFYIRNWIASGNPLFPVEIKIFGKVIFEGYKGINESLTSSSLLSNINWPTIKQLSIDFYHNTRLIIAVIGISIFFNFFNVIRKTIKKIKINLATEWILVLSTISYLLLYMKAPYSYRDMEENIRYSMVFLILGCVNIGYFAYQISKTKALKIILYLGSLLLMAYSFFFIIQSNSTNINFSKQDELFFAVLIISLTTLALVFIVQKLENKKIALLSSLILIIISFFTFWQTSNFTLKERNDNNNILKLTNAWYPNTPSILNLMKASIWLNKNAPVAKIAYAGFHLFYLLYGPNLDREVDYANINECLSCTYVDYRNSKDGIRRDPSYENWLANLKKLQKNYLVIDAKSMTLVKIYEYDWASQNPQQFKQVFNEGDAYIYKILP